MNKLKQFWRKLQESFWFVPILIVAASIILAMVLIELHSSGSAKWLNQWPRLFGASAEGARGMLSTIAGSMITVVGITFSMTLMTLALASAQYTSRILRNFMRDRITQVVLGIFAGIFTYCLIVLRTIRSNSEGSFVPGIAVSFSVALVMGGIGVLIFFIHHIAASIQASNIIATVARETLIAIDRLFPEKIGEEPPNSDDDAPDLPLTKHQWYVVTAKKNGYLQSVDNATLLRVARENKTVVRMERGIGDFVVCGTKLVSLALKAEPEKDIIAALRAAYQIDRHRTVHQDCAFGIRQIVDMALRSLSPGINDTTTAIMCVDYLTAILARLASRGIPSRQRYEEGKLSVIAIGPTFASLVAESFDQIRGSAGDNVAIMIRMLGGLETIACLTTSQSRRQVLGDHIQWITELAIRTIESPRDKARFETKLAGVLEALA